jgi:hypothetical protein
MRAPRLVSAVLLLAWVACRDEDAYRRPPDVDAGMLCASCGGCEEKLTVTSAFHVVGTVPYQDLPPVGGDHNACWATWGVHDAEVEPEHWVHNLEHGGVVLLYHCDDGCDADIEQLRKFVANHPRTLLTPYPQLPRRFGVVAWEHRLLSDCVDQSALEAFYAARYEHGLEDIPDPPSTICQERPGLEM